LHYTYENMDWKLDYEKLRIYLSKALGVTVAYYFIGKTKQNEDIHRSLESYNYTLKLKEPSPHTTEEEYCPYCKKVITPELYLNKSDCDSFMTLEIVSNRPIYDKAVIITSDGDFDDVVKMLVREDKLRLVLAPCKEGCSHLLKAAAGVKIAFIDDLKNELEKK